MYGFFLLFSLSSVNAEVLCFSFFGVCFVVMFWNNGVLAENYAGARSQGCL